MRVDHVGVQLRFIAMAASAARSSQKGLLNGYSSTILEKEDKRRYKEKLSIISGLDPYEIPKHRNSPLQQLVVVLQDGRTML